MEPAPAPAFEKLPPEEQAAALLFERELGFTSAKTLARAMQLPLDLVETRAREPARARRRAGAALQALLADARAARPGGEGTRLRARVPPARRRAPAARRGPSPDLDRAVLDVAGATFQRDRRGPSRVPVAA